VSIPESAQALNMALVLMFARAGVASIGIPDYENPHLIYMPVENKVPRYLVFTWTLLLTLRVARELEKGL
jgi:hypothetical protein